MITTKLFELRDEAERLRLDLEALKQREQPSYHASLQTEIDALTTALQQSRVPDYFKVAVVGQFKTGKSSFVNRLAEERLAGVETNPETAAISIFRHSDQARAEVKLLTREEWTRMEELYEESPAHPEAFRVAGLRSFNDVQAKKVDSKGEPVLFAPIDPVALADKWLTVQGNSHEIPCDDWTTKDGKAKFRKAIRQFTSTREPEHFFVKEIVIYAPVPILRDHVELIDTPGLNDTQLYRGQLTEDLLKEVDAILFLTQSGASFSQFDKEFLVRQLRKKRLRHVRLVVTQVDSTFEKARQDALEEDEDPPTFEEVKAKEESRLRAEIRRTLDELLKANDLNEDDGYYFIEQLDGLKIHFTSATWHRDGDVARSGIVEVREALFEVLSENYRLKQLVEVLAHSLEGARRRLRGFFRERRNLIAADFDSAKVKESIARIAQELRALMDTFGQQMESLCTAHDDDQDAIQELIEANVSKMQLLSKLVLDDYEKTDVAKHWRTRRAGYWGYLTDLGGRVADRVFPVMESMLNRQLKNFETFLGCAESALDGLQEEILGLERESEIDGLPMIEFAETKETFLRNYLEDLKQRLGTEKDGIVQLLDEFATSELKDSLDLARGAVTDIEGKGTTARQASEVAGFYDSIGSKIGGALSDFATKRFKSFGKSLRKSAKGVFPKLRTSIEALLSARSRAIEERLELQSGDAKVQLEAYLDDGLGVLEGRSLVLKAEVAPQPQAALDEVELRIEDRALGHSYESLFGRYLKGAKEIQIDEPYLGRRHQLQNFQRFAELVSRTRTIKQLTLQTGELTGEERDESESHLEHIRRELEGQGVSFSWTRIPTLHNRQIKTDHGWLLLSDRGLDIYKRPESRNAFGQSDLALRHCRATQIHIRKSL